MLITRKSVYSGITRTLEIDITEEQMQNYENGMYIQEAMSNLNDSEREFILTGMVDSEWDEIFDEQD